MVRPRRLELPRDIIPQRPQRCASTNSATAAHCVIGIKSGFRNLTDGEVTKRGLFSKGNFAEGQIFSPI